MSRFIALLLWVLSAPLVIGATPSDLDSTGQFIARIKSGEINLETYDFEAGGYWNLPEDTRAELLRALSIEFIGPGFYYERCDLAGRRRWRTGIWLNVLEKAPDAARWKESASIMRAGLVRLDEDVIEAIRSARLTAKDPLAARLQRRVARDIAVRADVLRDGDPTELPALAASMWPAVRETREMDSDCANTDWLKTQVDSIGWFDIPKYGKEADSNAWRLLQHSRRDPDFQGRMFDYLKALPPGATDPLNLAYLWDRVEAGRNHPQRFGTQVECRRDGTWELRETEDPAHLDERRRGVGLRPFAEYAASFPKGACPMEFL